MVAECTDERYSYRASPVSFLGRSEADERIEIRLLLVRECLTCKASNLNMVLSVVIQPENS